MDWGAAEGDEPRPNPGAADDCHVKLHRAIMVQTTGMILREVLHAHIPTLTAESTVRDAVDKMDVYQFPALVVVGLDLAPIAVVTEGDLCREVARRDSFVSMANEPVVVYSSKDPKCADVNLEISDALHLMLASGLTILPVTDEGVLAGVVLRVDLMQALMMDAASVA
jgi:signal-transduction protein with cAMP-binding, CBS, and nucleotidyltransferase domain